MTDSLQRTGDQIRQSDSEEYEASFKDFIKVVGNKDIQQITLSDGEFYRQNCIDRGNSPATVHKKLTEIKAMFELGVGLPPFYVPVVMRVYHTHSPCLEEGGAWRSLAQDTSSRKPPGPYSPSCCAVDSDYNRFASIHKIS